VSTTPARSTRRIGIQLPEVERIVPWHEYRSLAVLAEPSGFDSIWLGDHLLYRGDAQPERAPWEVWTLLGALAAATERVTLGPLVACLGFHPPAVLAKMAATIDEISAGRFVLGVGAGWNRTEFDAFGIPFDRRVDRFDEAYRVVQPLVTGQRVTLHGEFVDVDDCVLLPPLHRSVPLMVGSNGPRVLQLTLATADMWNTWFSEFGNTADGFAKRNEAVTRIAESVGRDPATVQRSACVLVITDHSSDERAPSEGVTALDGTPTQIAAGIEEIYQAGADEVIIVVGPIDARSVSTLAETVAIIRSSP
jgi:probable F420-dependent oxidoreductase